MKVAIGCDHAGFELKSLVLDWLKKWGHAPVDVGCHSAQAVDYPDFAAALGRAIAENQAERGILICGSGVGACIAVNKIKGVRGSVCHDTYSARQGVEHDDMNCLVLGARVIGTEVARELAETFLRARFSNEERHVRRLQKVLALERGES